MSDDSYRDHVNAKRQREGRPALDADRSFERRLPGGGTLIGYVDDDGNEIPVMAVAGDGDEAEGPIIREIRRAGGQPDDVAGRVSADLAEHLANGGGR